MLKYFNFCDILAQQRQNFENLVPTPKTNWVPSPVLPGQNIAKTRFHLLLFFGYILPKTILRRNGFALLLKNVSNMYI